MKIKLSSNVCYPATLNTKIKALQTSVKTPEHREEILGFLPKKEVSINLDSSSLKNTYYQIIDQILLVQSLVEKPQTNTKSNQLYKDIQNFNETLVRDLKIPIWRIKQSISSLEEKTSNGNLSIYKKNYFNQMSHSAKLMEAMLDLTQDSNIGFAYEMDETIEIGPILNNILRKLNLDRWLLLIEEWETFGN